MLPLLTLTAAADVAPPDMRSIDYTLTIDNLADYPDHVLLIYPTSNNGFAYVFEPDKAMVGLMVNSSRSGTTALYAMTRADFEARNPDPSTYNHGDNGEMVTVVPRPPSSALKADLDIRKPDLVSTRSPELGLDRVVHIETLDETAFVLSLVSEETRYTDGYQPIGTTPPKQTRCGTVAASGGLVSLSAVLMLLGRRRYPTSSPSQ